MELLHREQESTASSVLQLSSCCLPPSSHGVYIKLLLDITRKAYCNTFIRKSQPIARTEIETYIRNRMEACERLAPVANKFYQAQNAFMIASLACLMLSCKESMSNTFITILVFYASICLYNLSDAFQEYIHNRTYYRDFDARIRDVLDIFIAVLHFVLEYLHTPGSATLIITAKGNITFLLLACER